VCVLESGAFESDDATQELAAGVNIGHPYYPIDRNRQRVFGGTTNLWAGWCRPLDPHDLQNRPWIPDSGWPITHAELTAYYTRAHALCEIPSPEYDVAYWERASGARRLPIPAERVVTRMYTLSPPTRFGQHYRREIESSSNIRVYLRANATSFRLTSSGTAVDTVEVATRSGRRFRVASDCYVLATGGIENARLLLASRADRPSGIGNDHDLVGRYFMEHIHASGGELPVPATCPDLSLYSGERRMFSARLFLPPRVQQRECLLNANVMLEPLCPQTPLGALDRTRRAVFHWASLPARALFPARPTHGRTRSGHLDKVQLVLTLEQAPNAASRITLSAARDALGVPRVSVDWRTVSLDMTTFSRTRDLIALECERVGLGRLQEHRTAEPVWPPDPLQGMRGHHMGTTRMNRDPRAGVVDEHCRVHGMENLFIAGSSVFPTSGAGTPTVTILALALRLADRLKATGDLLARRRVAVSDLSEERPVATPVTSRRSQAPDR
jgi:choline dehydrogenase-like flavoprotein